MYPYPTPILKCIQLIFCRVSTHPPPILLCIQLLFCNVSNSFCIQLIFCLYFHFLFIVSYFILFLFKGEVRHLLMLKTFSVFLSPQTSKFNHFCLLCGLVLFSILMPGFDLKICTVSPNKHGAR